MTESMLPEDRKLVAVSQGARYIGVCAPAVLEEIKRLERELADAIRSLSEGSYKSAVDMLRTHREATTTMAGEFGRGYQHAIDVLIVRILEAQK